MKMAVDVVRATEGASLSWREARDVSQRVARMECGAALEVARTRALEAIECAKLEALENVGTVALGEAASLHQHAALHAARNPKLASRMTYIAEEAALLIGARMSRFGRTLG
jgi:hypothetical protein